MVKLPAQPGCTDPQALNFNPAATQNDGSCAYPPTTYALQQIAELPAALEECSGLAFFGNRLWTHEDGDGFDQLYVIDTLTGALLQTLTLPGTDNKDWEDLAEDSENLYIGDFGNNQGNRTNLNILKIKKSNILAGNPVAEVINFSFSDQTNFTPAPNANDFDCEAFFFWNDSLHLFSKNWVNFKTRHYVLPATPGTHVAQLRDSLAVQGQITAADISDDGTAVLLGYNVSTSETFLWLLFDFAGSDFFGGNKRKISMGSAIFVSQPEGIRFRNNRYGYICSERFSALPQKLLSFDTGQWTGGPNAAGELAPVVPVNVSPNPFRDFLVLDFQQDIPGKCEIRLSDLSGKILKKWSPGSIPGGTQLRLEAHGLQAGAYLLRIFTENGVATIRVFRG